jgi:curli production assembly/transport component CsgG
MKKTGIILSSILLMLLTSCGAYFNQPTKQQDARFGEEVYVSNYINNITPVKPIVAGVYKFRDQTGQYKQIDNGVSYSTVVTQGATTILIKALEDSKWFIPIERENVSNLLNERQIIRSTRNEDNKKKGINKETSLPPLLFAGILLEGGIISYDSNIITGGSGARYFGTGASVQYRQDRITVYLRAVSTSNGKILKTVYISKTILSQAIDVNLFKFVKLKRLLEAETGVSRNEPKQLVVKEAIEKAVESLIIEGIKDNVWKAKEGQTKIDSIISNYDSEKEIAFNTKLFERKINKQKSNHVINTAFFATYFDGDYKNSNLDYDGFQFGYKYYFKDSKFNIGAKVNMFTLSNEPIFSESSYATDLNVEYTFLPKDKLTPFAYGGVGAFLQDFDDIIAKFQYGLGIEYLVTENLGLRLFGEQNLLNTDDVDLNINGKRNDAYWKFGISLNIYIGN